MRRVSQLVLWLVVLVAALAAAGCTEGGIGMGVPISGGARWGTGGGGPDILVGGGPSF